MTIWGTNVSSLMAKGRVTSVAPVKMVTMLLDVKMAMACLLLMLFGYKDLIWSIKMMLLTKK